MKRGNSFIYIANPSRIRTHLSERLDPKVQRRLPKPHLSLSSSHRWTCVGLLSARHLSRSGRGRPCKPRLTWFLQRLCPFVCISPAICSWPLPFFPSLSVGSPTHRMESNCWFSTGLHLCLQALPTFHGHSYLDVCLHQWPRFFEYSSFFSLLTLSLISRSFHQYFNSAKPTMLTNRLAH